MASSFLALLDDIATLLDDIAVLSKVAATKTAGVLGDDLALNANQMTGLHPSREIPVVWEVTKGSLVNKVILVPAILTLSTIAPWLVSPLLMVGGAYLCLEGAEKLAHKFLHTPDEVVAHEKALLQAAVDGTVDLVAIEKDKIRGAIRTDFILSAEIVIIALATVAKEPFLNRLMVLSLVAFVMTLGVYGIVAAIVKIDDLGLWLQETHKGVVRTIGGGLVHGAPRLLKLLSVVGTGAMFLVGGAIILERIPILHEGLLHILHGVLDIPILGTAAKLLAESLWGILVGMVVLLPLHLIGKWRRKAP
ncbi:MAG: DUF808 domain-containing protein [Fibrobacteria bacterium]|nr:DUF808 domain-containing protein [Fibrobacteria bacterium]